MESILDTIKTMLDIEITETNFDTELVVHINSAIMALRQIGVGSQTIPFVITGKTQTWTDFLGSSLSLEAVKTYLYLKTRQVFDPPATSFVGEALQRQIGEYEFRLNVQAEGDNYVGE